MEGGGGRMNLCRTGKRRGKSGRVVWRTRRDLVSRQRKRGGSSGVKQGVEQ